MYGSGAGTGLGIIQTRLRPILQGRSPEAAAWYAAGAGTAVPFTPVRSPVATATRATGGSTTAFGWSAPEFLRPAPAQCPGRNDRREWRLGMERVPAARRVNKGKEKREKRKKLGTWFVILGYECKRSADNGFVLLHRPAVSVANSVAVYNTLTHIVTNLNLPNLRHFIFFNVIISGNKCHLFNNGSCNNKPVERVSVNHG